MSTTDLWTYNDSALVGNALVGLEVVAVDGEIGKVDEASDEAGTSGIVVDTGAWIFGKKVLLPAGVVDRVDLDEEKVYVNRTKDEIKNAPEYDKNGVDDDYRARLGAYYGDRDERGD
jgi:hypothetical protein